MTVKQLKKALNKYPDDMDVFMAQRKTDFDLGPVESVKKKKIDYKEDPADTEIMATDMVVVLDEE